MKKMILPIAIVIIVICFAVIYFTINSKEGVLLQQGYVSSEEDAFYKKIVTNNTLDDYYNDVKNKKNSKYEEYNFSKEANDFVEVKMLYKNNVSTTLNISSNLKTNSIEYNYELEFNDSRLIVEGNSANNYRCDVVLNENVAEATKTTLCNNVINEINNFKSIRDELISRKQIFAK